MRIIFESLLMLYKKLSKLVHACRNYSLLKLAQFCETHLIVMLH